MRPVFIPEVLILIFHEGSVCTMWWCWCCSQFPLTIYSFEAAAVGQTENFNKIFGDVGVTKTNQRI